jgi:hypothetical protein
MLQTNNALNEARCSHIVPRIREERQKIALLKFHFRKQCSISSIFLSNDFLIRNCFFALIFKIVYFLSTISSRPYRP